MCNVCMDPRVYAKINEKIQHTISNQDEIKRLIELFDETDLRSTMLGIIMGRLYNSFYYQSKRILNREPTSSEFEEFLEFVRSQYDNFDLG